VTEADYDSDCDFETETETDWGRRAGISMLCKNFFSAFRAL
jgi:hypothetical protein